MPDSPQQFRPRRTTAPQYRPREARGTAAQRGYGTRWGKIRDHGKGTEADAALCDWCLQEGVARRRHVLDHVIPHNGPGDPLLHDDADLRGLCYRHHTMKTKRQDAAIRAEFDRLIDQGTPYDEARDRVVAAWRHKACR